MTDDIKALRDALAGVPKVQQWRAYVHPLQPEELRGYADVVGSHRDDDVAENVPIPLARYIAACHPERIARLLDALEAAQKDAARWRYARLHCYVEVWCDSPKSSDWDAAALDRNIDAAMKGTE